MTHDPAAPSALRSSILLAVAVAGGIGLWHTPVGPSLDLADVSGWWATVGPPAAAVSIVRAVGLVVAGATAFCALLGLVVAVTESTGAARLWTALAPASLRRVVAVSVLAAGLHATTAGAQVTDDRSVPLLIDLGPVDRSVTPDDPPDPAPDSATDPIDEAAGSPTADEASDDNLADDSDSTWTVRRGEHLWAIAAETLADRGGDTHDAAIADYWRQLIETNRSVIGTDADLIHPGMVLTLPD